MADKQTILVTGSTGFIGARFVEALYLGGTANVRAGIRSWSSAARIARFPVDIVFCDIMDPAQIREAMSGVTAVIHCAYVDNRDAIVQGTNNMLEAALESGVERFVYLSTAEVYGNVSGEVDETSPYQHTGSEYADSKIEAEELCWAFYDKGLPVTVVRPSIVYGPFSEAWTIGFAERLQSGNWGMFENYGEGKCNLVYVDDLVSAVLLAVTHKKAIGQAFNINGPDTVTWNEYFQRFNDAMGLSPLAEISAGKSKLKTAVADQVSAFTGFFVDRFEDRLMDIYLRGGVANKVMKLVKNSLNTTPSAAELKGLYNRNAIYTTEKAQRLLGYRQKYDLEEGLRISTLWLDHHGYLQQSPPSSRNGNAGNRSTVINDERKQIHV